jgi:HEAT repeat protein
VGLEALELANTRLAPLEWEWRLDSELLAEQASALSALAIESAPWPAWNDEGDSRKGGLARLRPDQGTPEDSLFRAAREALNRGEYARASGLFRSLDQKYPRSRVAPAALYWQAFALYRAGSTDELRTALAALSAQKDRYPEAAGDADVRTLRARIYAALAARGDPQAANMLRAETRAGGADCDREEAEVRAEALNALAQINPPEARPTLKKVLARRDECSTTLRRRAVYILARDGSDDAAADLLEVAKTDPDAGVRSDAIILLGRAPGTTTVRTLEQLFNESTDDRTRDAVLSALRAKGGPEARRALRAIIERKDLPEQKRAAAILSLAGNSRSRFEFFSGPTKITAGPARGEGDEEDGVWLRGLYDKTDSRAVKAAIISSVARIGGGPNDQWLMGIAKNKEEDTSLRREALSRLRTSTFSVEDLGKLFDALSERDLREAIISQLGSREEPAATDKLIEIARSGTDPHVRRAAIVALTRKKDPRATKLLLDLLEKP